MSVARKKYQLGGARASTKNPKPWGCKGCGGRLFKCLKTRHGQGSMVAVLRQYECLHCHKITHTQESLRF